MNHLRFFRVISVLFFLGCFGMGCRSQQKTMQPTFRTMNSINSPSSAQQEVARLHRFIEQTKRRYFSNVDDDGMKRKRASENANTVESRSSRKTSPQVDSAPPPSSPRPSAPQVRRFSGVRGGLSATSTRPSSKKRRKRTRCQTICLAAKGICRSAMRICKIAKRFPSKITFQMICKKANRDCLHAQNNCKTCQP